jgi:hypothetical protein
MWLIMIMLILFIIFFNVSVNWHTVKPPGKISFTAVEVTIEKLEHYTSLGINLLPVELFQAIGKPLYSHIHKSYNLYLE